MSGYRYLGDGDTDRHEILSDCLAFGGTPKWPKIPNFDREYLENGKSQRYMSNGLDETFLKKRITWDGSRSGPPL